MKSLPFLTVRESKCSDEGKGTEEKGLAWIDIPDQWSGQKWVRNQVTKAWKEKGEFKNRDGKNDFAKETAHEGWWWLGSSEDLPHVPFWWGFYVGISKCYHGCYLSSSRVDQTQSVSVSENRIEVLDGDVRRTHHWLGRPERIDP